MAKYLLALFLLQWVAPASSMDIPVPNTGCTVQNVTQLVLDGSGVLHYQGGTLAGSCGGVVPPPSPPPSGCVEGQPSDTLGFTRQCYSSVKYSYGADGFSAALTDYAQVFGPWSGGPGNKQGQAAIMDVKNNKYISLALTPTANTSKLSTNVSWGVGGTVTISTVPGIFDPTNPKMVAGCFQNRGGTNNLIASANHWSAANCQLNAGQTYYVNFANMYNGQALLCKTNPCPGMAYTPLLVN